MNNLAVVLRRQGKYEEAEEILASHCIVVTSNKDLLWLPADCRPGESAVFGTIVAMGTPLRRIVVIRFSAEGPARL
ncbi:hypothetical protein HD806DRAFT_487376 [Xylariaceae sp. AK1471]|nr:hypothetical protein HD806DRAFT_487376 [Xylariaceae sp. AK1471]